MTRFPTHLLAAAALAVLAATARADDFSSALGPVFQGDLPQTLARLKALPDDALSAKARPIPRPRRPTPGCRPISPPCCAHIAAIERRR